MRCSDVCIDYAGTRAEDAMRLQELPSRDVLLSKRAMKKAVVRPTNFDRARQVGFFKARDKAELRLGLHSIAEDAYRKKNGLQMPLRVSPCLLGRMEKSSKRGNASK